MAKYTNWLTDEGLLKIEGWARDGLSDKEIALDKIGVAESTFSDWKKKFPELSESLKKGKEVVDRQVENALYKRAIGYEYTERTAKVVDRDKALVAAERREYENRYKIDHPDAELQEIKDAAVKAVPTTERIVFLEVDKQVAPDTGAAAFWLKNRKPDVWRDKPENKEKVEKLLDAQIEKAEAEAKILADKAEKLSAGGQTNDLLMALLDVKSGGNGDGSSIIQSETD